MKKRILSLVILNVLLFGSGVYASELKAEEELDNIYSKILCIGCEGRNFISHDCPIAKNLRAKVKSLFEKGFNKEEIIWNFNADNIAFIYQLPAEVIRNLNCPCACAEKVWVCLASENRYSCAVIEIVVEDIEKLKQQDKSDSEIVRLLKNSQYQQKYNLIIESAIKAAGQIQNFNILNIPDFVLDNAKCSCECTETLRTCIEKMPWCKRIKSMIDEAIIYLHIMKLEPEDVVSAMYAPCAKECGKKIEGEYLGKNCYACLRPVIDKAYYKEINGEKRVYCCESCYEMGNLSSLPQAILNNARCKVCPCKKLLSECNSGHCPLVILEKKLIKTWLLQDMAQEEVIMKLR